MGKCNLDNPGMWCMLINQRLLFPETGAEDDKDSKDLKSPGHDQHNHFEYSVGWVFVAVHDFHLAKEAH